jgi:hypothetical protein
MGFADERSGFRIVMSFGEKSLHILIKAGWRSTCKPENKTLLLKLHQFLGFSSSEQSTISRKF